MSMDKQEKDWVDGNPWHSGQLPDGECCPDFSCCRPGLLSDEATRQAYAAATEDQRFGMRVIFLGKLLELSPVEVHVAGDPANYEDPT